MSTEDKATITPDEWLSVSSNVTHLPSLETACQSGDEQRVRSILSQKDCTNYLESYPGYLLLNLTLLSFHLKLTEKYPTISEEDKSQFISICKMLLQNGVKVNDETQELSSTTTPLHLAVEVENKEIVNLLLSKGAAVNKKNYNEETPLHRAVWKSSKNIVQILLENGADPGNCGDYDYDNFTPIHIAVLRENEEILEMLLSKVTAKSEGTYNCDSSLECDFFKDLKSISQLFLENPDNSDNIEIRHDICMEQTITPLQIAVLNVMVEIMELLVSNGVDIDGKDCNWNTALHYAVFNNDKYTAQFLLKEGADLDIRNKEGRKPFDYSKDASMKQVYSHYRIKMYLDNGGCIEEKDDDGFTLLHHAVKYNSKDAISFLLDLGCNVNAVSNLGESPLHVAVKEQNEEITLLLLQTGCDVNATTNTGCTALHLAAADNHYTSFALLRLLIENDANLKLKNKFGLVPLNYAVKRQSSLKAQLLLGKNPDKCDKELKMAFCLSFLNHNYARCSSRNEEDSDYSREDGCLSEFFFNLGFRIHVKDFEDMHIPEELYSDWLSQFSTDEKFCPIVRNFLNKQAAFDTNDMNRLFIEFEVLLGAVNHGFMDIFLNLFTSRMNVNARLQDGNTLLHYASMHNQLTIVAELLRRGAAVNALNDKNETPLHVSVRSYHTKVVQVLLDEGADVDARDAANDTPLFAALHEEPDISIIRLLVEYGANVNCLREKHSPLHMALYYCETFIVELLFHYGAFVNASDLFKITPTYPIWKFYDNSDIDDHLRIVNLVFDYGAKVVDLCPDLFDDPNECAKLKVKSIAANLENFEFSANSTEIAEYQSKCLEEVARMKSMKIGGCNISMYDLLVKSQRQCAMYMRNANVVEMLDSMEFKKKFPIYASKLNVCVRRGKLENRLLELCYECLVVILKRKLPDVIVSEIISYFSTSDLHRLIIASPIAREKKETVKYPFIIIEPFDDE